MVEAGSEGLQGVRLPVGCSWARRKKGQGPRGCIQLHKCNDLLTAQPYARKTLAIRLFRGPSFCGSFLRWPFSTRYHERPGVAATQRRMFYSIVIKRLPGSSHFTASATSKLRRRFAGSRADQRVMGSFGMWIIMRADGNDKSFFINCEVYFCIQSWRVRLQKKLKFEQGHSKKC